MRSSINFRPAQSDLLGDFPFEDAASQTNTLALLLQPFVRPMIAGPTPLYVINEATPGTGKGLLAEIVSVVATGRAAAPSAPAENDTEYRKRIFAAMRADPAILLIDNVNHFLDSPSMASYLTARTIRDRPMGESRLVEIPVRCTWVSTGNNVRMTAEIARRVASIRLVSTREDPQNRPATDFKYPNLIDWAQQNRGRLIQSALTLISAWIVEGRPDGTLTVGSYEDWSRVMSGIMTVIPSSENNSAINRMPCSAA